MEGKGILSDGVKKIFLAGIGAVATTAEKSQEVLNDLVSRGEISLEQGKALNEELKRTIKGDNAATPEDKAEKIVGGLSKEELKALQEKLAAMDAE